jgi:hypothetical protein
MLSYGYWQDRFGGDANVVGKSIEINNTRTEIVGVMPRGFRLGDSAVDLIGPFRMNRAQMIPPPFCCNGIARLREGVTSSRPRPISSACCRSGSSDLRSPTWITPARARFTSIPGA